MSQIVNIQTALIPKPFGFTVANTNVSDATEIVFGFRGNISVGNPPQSFQVLFDTGSSLSWISQKFMESKSSTFTTLNKPEKISYADGTKVGGSLCKDSFYLDTMRLDNFTWLHASSIENLRFTGQEGVIGLAPTGSSKVQSYGDALRKSKLTGSVFSYFIDNTQTNGGFTFGGIDTSRYAGHLLWIPLVGQGQDFKEPPNHWRVSVGGLKVNNSPIAITKNLSAIFDTGTSVAIFPDNIAKALNTKLGLSLVPGSETQWSTTCSIASRLPPVSLDFETGTVVLNNTDYMYQVADSCYSIFNSYGYETSNQIQGIILGNAFLRKFYTVHDTKALKIGIAVANRNITTSSTFVIADSTNPPIGRAQNIPSQYQYPPGSNRTSRQFNGASLKSHWFVTIFFVILL